MLFKVKSHYFLFYFLLFPFISWGQGYSITGYIRSNQDAVPMASVYIENTNIGTESNDKGYFEIKNIMNGEYHLIISCIGFIKQTKKIKIDGKDLSLNIALEMEQAMEEVVVTGALQEVSRSKSPTPVEIYSAEYFKKNPTPSLFDALQIVNGVRPQTNCNICNTGDIHINGLEGPYTMVTIDGMPIMGGLATVYGLNGIPNSMIDRIEVIKGPASTMYGSEAVGGLINVITKDAYKAPKASVDIMGTSWGELNLDVGTQLKFKKANTLIGINHFNYSFPKDNNHDGFTDVTLSKRTSIFNKWQFERQHKRIAVVGLRYIYEDRWGGDMKYNNTFRGTDSIYGESIYTNRFEILGSYQLPIQEKVMAYFSGSFHDQDSYYGTTAFMANQKILFSQLTWNKKLGAHYSYLLGLTYRYTFYDDNTITTYQAQTNQNAPANYQLPGAYLENEWKWNEKNTSLIGIRYDYNSLHGNIITPRLNHLWKPNASNIIRLSAGTGYRVANVITEDHAALTGARTVVFEDELKPERSMNVNINYQKFIHFKNTLINIDASLFYTHFQNRIIPDYNDPNKIIYRNLDGYSVSQGATFNLEITPSTRFKVRGGFTAMDVYKVEKNTENNYEKNRPYLTEKFSATWAITYYILEQKLSIDYTGNVYSPMKLPLLSSTDPRAPESPWYSIQNIQCTYKSNYHIEFYGGIKNLLNFTPPANAIARSHDPFDKQVQFDSQGNAIATNENPYALTFDPTYVYASNQGRRFFLGIRYTLP